MPKHRYATKLEGVKAVGRDLPISTKQSVEICSFIRGKNLQKAKKLLLMVIIQKQAVPFRRYLHDVGHKHGMAAGRYPVKASKHILTLLESVEVNAQVKGLNTSSLGILHIAAHKAAQPLHGGRHRGRTMKRTHVEIIVNESADKNSVDSQRAKRLQSKENTKPMNSDEKHSAVKKAVPDPSETLNVTTQKLEMSKSQSGGAKI
jgi:large subunit ribosomal protein L22